jgi:S-DNA-T family DNA segregation ATPase FtsK/SpoIIIE
MVRIQCAFIDVPETDAITKFISTQRGFTTALYLPEFVDENGSPDISEIDLSKRDGLFNDAARLVVIHQQGSTSLIQRKFSIGYNRAGRIMDQLEAAGIVGPPDGSKPRQVFFPDEYSLEQFLHNFNK